MFSFVLIVVIKYLKGTNEMVTRLNFTKKSATANDTQNGAVPKIPKIGIWVPINFSAENNTVPSPPNAITISTWVLNSSISTTVELIKLFSSFWMINKFKDFFSARC